MPPITVDVRCSCCPTPGNLLYQQSGELEQFKAAIAEGRVPRAIGCVACGCQFDIADLGDSIGQSDVTRPRIDALSVASAPCGGGWPVTVSGHALDHGTLVVRFDGVAAANARNRSDGHATVDTPIGRIKLNTQGAARRKLAVSAVLGTFQVGETINGSSSNASAVVREVSSNYLYVDSATGEFATTETITGAISAATARAGTFGNWQPGETVLGMSSNNSGALVSAAASQIKVSGPTGGFNAGEWVRGGASGTKVQLAASNHKDGSVVVSVENEFGRRDFGSSLAGAFTFTV